MTVGRSKAYTRKHNSYKKSPNRYKEQKTRIPVDLHVYQSMHSKPTRTIEYTQSGW